MLTPVNIITGYLGVGKSTAIRHLLTQSPQGARWAVLVNEFGDVPIDGGALQGGGLAVKELAGGCICCTLGSDMEAALGELLEQVKPDRILIEPTGLGHPGGVIEAITEGKYKDKLSLKTVLCLVDAAMLADPQITQRKTFIDQVAISDVLLAAKGDRLDDTAYHGFKQWAADLFPPKEVVGKVEHGALSPEWLDLHIENRLDNYLLQQVGHTSHHHAHHHHKTSKPSEPQLDQPVFFENKGFDHIGGGWIFHVEERFHEYKLMELFEGKLPGLDQVVRLKGLFRVGPGRRILIDRVGQALTVNDSIAYWRDSRIEVILSDQHSQPQWLELEEAMMGSRWKKKRA
ncbi:CobW family GTP-binding protein [Magnetococcus sp. PR-3]|uniref:CobW family GTP-binding protein n=1 Tax=Magnetococcus sp. PR-3 TaxID=3120355 RepID=UPI002FCE0A18